MSIAKDWRRIPAWYGREHPEPRSPSPGATQKQLTDLETLIGTHLPDEFCESYTLHNGTGGGSILYYGLLHSLEGIATEWKMYRKWQEENGYGKGFDWRPAELVSPEIRPYWGGPLRLPITDNGGGDPVTLDLDPMKKRGTRGQIIKLNHEVGPINVLAPSFAAWLERIAGELEAGIHADSQSGWMVCPVAWGRK